MALVKYNNNSISAVTSAASMPSGALVPIKTLTASSSATLSFVHGSSDVVLDSTYPIYIFKFINIHPATDATKFTFNGSDDDSSHSYDVPKTSCALAAFHHESAPGGPHGNEIFQYNGGSDLGNGTGFQHLSGPGDSGADADQSQNGELWLFKPSSTTFITHWKSNMSNSGAGAGSSAGTADQAITAGYFNTAEDITAIQFKQSSGNLDSGKIKLYGIKDS